MDTTLTIKTKKTLRNEVKKTAAELGIPVTTAINAMMRQFVRDRRLVLEDCPFPSHTPNAETRRAIREALDGRGKIYSGSTKDIFDAVIKKS